MALDAYHRGIDLGVGIKYAERGIGMFSLAHLYLELNDVENALKFFEQAQEQADQYGLKQFRNILPVLVSACYRKSGSVMQALELLQHLLSRYKAQPELESVFLGELGMLLFENGAHENAIEVTRSAIAKGRQGVAQWDHMVDILHLNLANMLVDIGDYEGAERELVLFEKFEGSNIRGIHIPDYFVTKASIEKYRRSKELRRTLEESILQIEMMRRSMPAAMPRQIRASQALETLFAQLIVMDFENMTPIDGYMRCQNARSRRILGLLSKVGLKPPEQVDSHLAESERQLLFQLGNRVEGIMAPSNPYLGAIDQAEYDSILEELESIWIKMFASAPAYVNFRRGEIPEISHLKTLVNEYDIGDN